MLEILQVFGCLLDEKVGVDCVDEPFESVTPLLFALKGLPVFVNQRVEVQHRFGKLTRLLFLELLGAD